MLDGRLALVESKSAAIRLIAIGVSSAVLTQHCVEFLFRELLDGLEIARFATVFKRPLNELLKVLISQLLSACIGKQLFFKAIAIGVVDPQARASDEVGMPVFHLNVVHRGREDNGHVSFRVDPVVDIKRYSIVNVLWWAFC